MKKRAFLNAVKVLVIIILVLAIGLLAFLHWKKDFIIRKVMEEARAQMTDSLRYSEASLNWFSSFPSVAIEIRDLHIGSGKHPLVKGGDVGVVLKLFPLFRDQLVISRLQVRDAHLHVVKQNGMWSYDILRQKTEAPSGDAFSTLIRRFDIDNTRLTYHDGDATSLTFYVLSAVMEGGVAEQHLDAHITCAGTIEQWKSPAYVLPAMADLHLDGRYRYDMKTGMQEVQDFKVNNTSILASVDGTLLSSADRTDIDLELTWKKGIPEEMKAWLPVEKQETWKAFTLSGETDGNATITGASSSTSSPRILANIHWKDGGIDFLTGDEDLKGLDVEMKYDTGDKKSKQPSGISVLIKKGGILGRSMTGDIRIHDLQQPVVDASVQGDFPASLLNLFSVPGVEVQEGRVDIKQLDVHDFSAAEADLVSFITSAEAQLEIDGLSLQLFGRRTSLDGGSIRIAGRTLTLDASALAWSEAKATRVKGSFQSRDDQLDYTVSGHMCDGAVEVKGTLTGMQTAPVMQSQWALKSIEMSDLLTSFSNFDQSFITGDHLSGKADVWAEATIPMNQQWKIRTHDVSVRSAIHVREGRLKNMKTLEDFASYVHLEDLQDIRFSELRNYLKIESGKIFLPVMFIQSNAINLSISGVHGFDQKILYNVKLNAGQAAANKLKKTDFRKELKPARKSGWINMYFVLEGTTSQVRYQQYRTAVISGFEQSARLKEELRRYLVDTFGYDVYWIEPNEWEDIPEYK